MAKTAKKKMAKAALKRTLTDDARATKQELRRAIKEQKEIQRLATALQHAAHRADGKLADARTFIAAREAKLSGPAAGH